MEAKLTRIKRIKPSKGLKLYMAKWISFSIVSVAVLIYLGGNPLESCVDLLLGEVCDDTRVNLFYLSEVVCGYVLFFTIRPFMHLSSRRISILRRNKVVDNDK